MRSRRRQPWPTEAWITIIALITVLVVVVKVQSSDDAAASREQPTTEAAPTSAAEPSASTATSLPSTTTTTTAPPTTTTAMVPTTASVSTSTTRAMLAGLRMAADDANLPEYRRDMFGGGWDYDPVTGCNTREKVLIEESIEPPVMGDRCKPSSGRWVSLYDGVTVTSPADLQIDHFVPLAEAWRSGAAAWSGEQRLAFANDLTDPNTLIAVTGDTNTSKSDSGPQEWLPPDRTAWCSYVERWVGVKARWNLSITSPEKSAIERVLAGC